MRYLKLTLISSLLILQYGCAYFNVSSGSSMDVEVEVYRGPLSKSIETQWAELIAYSHRVESTCGERTTDVLEAWFKTIDSNDSNFTTLKKLYDEAITAYANPSDQRLKTNALLSLINLSGDVLSSADKMSESLFENQKKDFQKTYLMGLTRCAIGIQVKAYEQAIWESNQQSVAKYSAEQNAIYAKILLSRADLLLRQLEGEDRHFLPLSAYLAEASPSLFTEFCYKNPTCDNDRGNIDIDFEEPNIADALLNENYWQRINRVHSSGLGNVNTAFIKDDIGNWSLKSFESDPGELLNAYQNLGIETIATVGRLTSGNLSASTAKSIDENIGRSKKLLAFSETMAFGNSNTRTNINVKNRINHLRNVSILSLKSIKVNYDQKLQENRLLIEENNKSLDSKRAELDDASSKLTQPCNLDMFDSSDCFSATPNSENYLSELQIWWVNKRKALIGATDPTGEQSEVDQAQKERIAKRDVIYEYLTQLDSLIIINNQLSTLENENKHLEKEKSELTAKYRDAIVEELNRFTSSISAQTASSNQLDAVN